MFNSNENDILKKQRKYNYDFILIIAVILLSLIGVIFISSSGLDIALNRVHSSYIKQSIFLLISLFVTVFFSFIQIDSLKRFSLWFYILLIAILIITLVLGREVNGAKSWLFIGQPSEFGKILFIFALSYYYSLIREKQLIHFIIALGLTCIPVSLILLQPDFGTAIVYFVITFFISFTAKIPIKYLFFFVFFLIFFSLFTLLPIVDKYLQNSTFFLVTILNSQFYTKILLLIFIITCLLALIGFLYFNDKIYYTITYFTFILSLSLIASLGIRSFLKPYQEHRLVSFVNPSLDEKGISWNINQVMIAIGLGGFNGQGLFKGTQSHNFYVPEQSTDFIFSIIAEEWGFLGSFLVLFLYFIIFLRLILTLSYANSSYHMYLVSGVLGFIFAHFFINIGMVIGYMPVTGIPLIFLSYGGSSLLSAWLGIGIALSAYRY